MEKITLELKGKYWIAFANEDISITGSGDNPFEALDALAIELDISRYGGEYKER